MSKSLATSIVSLGRIQRPKGLHGQMRVTTRGDLLSSVPPKADISLFKAEKILDSFLVSPQFHSHLKIKKIESVFSDYIVLSAYGYDSIEKVENIKGLFLGFDVQELPPWLALEDELYLFEYIGLEVRDLHGKIYGSVIRIEQNTSSPLLVVKTEDREVLVPLHAPYVKKPLRKDNFLQIEDFSHFL